MQPYFFPYIGYFQLITAVDKFVIYDDVNFIKQGWINRNRVLLNGSDFLFTLRLNGSSSFKKINEIRIGAKNETLLKTVTQCYRNAPFYSSVYPYLESIFLQEETNLAKYLSFSLKVICDYLSINTELIFSSEIEKNNQLKSQAKVVDICKKLGADKYINAIGGIELYNKDYFQREKITLMFIKSNPIKYKQFDNEFVPGLSIIDLMMFNVPEKINDFLNQYELV